MNAASILFRPFSRPTMPGPENSGLLGDLPVFRRDPLAYLLDVSARYGDVVRIPMGPRSIVLVAHPDGVRRVLQENAKNYTKQTRGFDVVRELLGQGLLTSENPLWLRQRRLIQPAFHRQRLAGFGQTMVSESRRLAGEWSQAARYGQTIDAAADMMRLTLRIAGLTLFNIDVSGEAREFGHALKVVLRYANARISNPLQLPRFVPTQENREATRAAETLDRVVREIIDTRRRQGGPDDDLLAMLMQATDEDTGERMNDTQLRDEVMTLLLAGHETTANALAWTWMLLSRFPDVRRRLVAEVDAVVGVRDPAFDDLPSLVYTRMVIDESMRLFPPAWIFSRAPAQADEILGHTVAAGTFVFVSPWVTHRRPDLWENPEGFDPERFRPERVAKMPRYAYFPFGGGPRQCIGNNFALAEMVLVLAVLARRFRLDLLPGARIEPEPTITLRPRDGVPMRVVEV